ncbi:unnamed protein product [Victoria cruziana]
MIGRPSLSNYSSLKYMDGGGDGHDFGSKCQRLMESNPYYGNSPGPSFMYGNASYMSQLFGQPQPFPVVRLLGLRLNCTEIDIAVFFMGLDIVDVLFVHKNGRFSEEGFCVLAYPVQVDFTLQRNKQNLSRRYIEVFQSKRQEYYQTVADEVADSRSISPCRPLPRMNYKGRYIGFLKDFEVSEENVRMVFNLEGRATAAMVKDRMSIGSRYIELFPSSHDEAEEVTSPR